MNLLSKHISICAIILTMKQRVKKLISHLSTKESILLCLILIIAATFRFWNFPNQYSLDGDSVRDAIVAYEGAKQGFFPLAGAFSSTGPYTFGPWFYIGLIFTSAVFPFIYTPYILMSVISLISVLVMYDIGRTVKSKNFGLLLALVTALSPSEIIASYSVSNITPVPFFSILSLWVAFRIIITPKIKMYWFVLLGLFFCFAISSHYQSMGLLLLPVIMWFYLKKKTINSIFLFLLGLFITLIPMLIFNVLNNWHTINGIQEMLIARERIYVANSWRIYVFEFWPSLLSFIFGLQPLTSMVVLVVMPVLFLFLILKKKIEPIMFIPAIILLVNFLYLRYYWGERNWVYHFYLEPLIIFLICLVIYKLYFIKHIGMFLSLILLISFLSFMTWNNMDRINQPENSVRKQMQIINTTFPDKKIQIYKCLNDRNPIADGVAYLSYFEPIPANAPIQKIGMNTESCIYPASQQFNFKTAKNPEELKFKVYPMIKGTDLQDFSAASESGLKQILWQKLDAKDIFKKTTGWY